MSIRQSNKTKAEVEGSGKPRPSVLVTLQNVDHYVRAAQFRDGMMRAKGRDFLFRKANGDMNFQK